MTRELDLICFGRAAVDLYGNQIDSPLEEIQSFDKSVGGCAANIAIGTARQGLRVGMLTRVGDEHMGRFVRSTLELEGVDVSHVSTDPERLTGLVLLSVADRNTFPLVFYRENCADMAVDPDLVDFEWVARAGAVLLTGTHLSTERTRATSLRLIDAAKEAGARIILDIDYRPVLWKLTGHGLGEERYVPSAEVTARIAPILSLCDLVVGTEEEVAIAGGLEAVRAACDTLVMKRGPLGCVIYRGEEEQAHPGNPVEVLNVLGAGDAFMSGFLRGWLQDRPLAECAHFANAMGAIVVSRHTCSTAMPSKVELDHYLATQEIDDGLHRLTDRLEVPEPLHLLAFDHRKQLEALGPAERLSELKEAIADAVEEVGGDGVIIDAQYGRAALARMTRAGFFVARPIEVPQERPLTFIGAPNVELEIASWPQAQVVKVLVHAHPEDEHFAVELASLQRLQGACHQLRREWLLEVIPHRDGALERSALPQVMARFIDAGLRPDWWKLPDPVDWAEIEVQVARDPYCRGVLLLGLAASEEALAESFARASSVCRGFAVGRTIFLEPAQKFLSGDLDRKAFTNEVAAAFRRLMDRW